MSDSEHKEAEAATANSRPATAKSTTSGGSGGGGSGSEAEPAAAAAVAAGAVEKKPADEKNGNEKSGDEKADLKDQFEAFSKFGDKTADGKTIKLSQSDKWFKQAKVIDGKKMSTTDTGIAFRKISKNGPKLSFVEWNKYLDEIAKNKSIEVNEIKEKLVTCGKPGFTGATTVTKSSVTDRLTDSSKYGGTHKQRFDPAGKGRGKAGRVDPKAADYVSGYKEKGTYDKTH